MTRLLQGWTITNGLAVIWRTAASTRFCSTSPACLRRSHRRRLHPGRPPRAGHQIRHGPRRRRRRREARSRLITADPGPRAPATSSPTTRGLATEFVGRPIPTGDSPRGVAVSARRRRRLRGQLSRRFDHRHRPRRRGGRRAASTWAARDGSPTPAGASGSSTTPTSRSAASSPATPATRTATSTGSPTTSRPTASA